tara:strand:- start:21027 stop:21512 length:486 start_codon:yes stop_codon:yes gene_type:complete
MSTIQTFSNAPQLPNPISATFTVNASDPSGIVDLFLVSDNGRVSEGMKFTNNGNNEVEEWTFVWDDNSFVANLVLATSDAGFVPGTDSYQLPIQIEYISNRFDGGGVSSSVYWDDNATAELYLYAASIKSAGTIAAHSYQNGDMIKITVYPNATLTKIPEL